MALAFAKRAGCKPMARSWSRRTTPRIVAFKETDVVHDWRTQKMMEVAHKYYVDVWSKGSKDAFTSVIADNIIVRDQVWNSAGMIVGRRAFKDHLQEQRREYPDMYFEIEQLGLQDTTHLFVRWTCHGTHLESPSGPASHHNSVVGGVDILAFSADRTQIVEVEQFRQANHEEHRERAAQEESSPYEIKLARLHWESHVPKDDKAAGPVKSAISKAQAALEDAHHAPKTRPLTPPSS